MIKAELDECAALFLCLFTTLSASVSVWVVRFISLFYATGGHASTELDHVQQCMYMYMYMHMSI